MLHAGICAGGRPQGRSLPRKPPVLAQTRLTISQHQDLTLANFLRLRMAAPDLPFVPVLQGWAFDDYLRHRELYFSAGIDLTREPLVGLGSVCRRQATAEIEVIVERLALEGIRLHGFGVKNVGLERYADLLASADSMAWSFRARRDQPLPGCPHRSCSSCLPYALAWRDRVLASLQAPRQMRLGVVA